MSEERTRIRALIDARTHGLIKGELESDHCVIFLRDRDDRYLRLVLQHGKLPRYALINPFSLDFSESELSFNVGRVARGDMCGLRLDVLPDAVAPALETLQAARSRPKEEIEEDYVVYLREEGGKLGGGAFGGGWTIFFEDGNFVRHSSTPQDPSDITQGVEKTIEVLDEASIRELILREICQLMCQHI